MRLGKSQREKEVRRVASVAAYNADGLLLFGKREDSGKWTLPGGHLEPGEEPMDGARRELEEEAGLKGQDFEFLGRGLGGPKGDIIIYSYRCKVEGEPNGEEDPDQECKEWRWVEALDIPPEIGENLHSPKNVTLRLLGLQDGEVEEPMAKADPHFVERNPYRGSQGIRIPKYGTKSRKKWDADYLQAIAHHFADGDVSRLRPVQVPTDGVSGVNMPVNQSRLKLYKRMLQAKDRLPPVVVKRVGLGYHLLDGNHRQAAAQHAKLPLLNAVEVMDPPLRKGLPALGLAAALSMGGAMPKQQPQQKPVAAYEVAQELGAPTWTPEGLHEDLWPIAHLESSWGQNLAHASNKKGEFHTAFGALGFKPVTAHEEYLKSKYMQGKYPDLNAPEKFLATFKGDPKFYNLLASAHFARLKHRHGGAQQAAFAWRWGTGAASNATPEQVQNDIYVQKYTHMNLHGKQSRPTIKDPLVKSAVSDKLIERIKPHLTDDLRRSPWKGNPNCLAGHCYVASEALWHLLGGEASGYVPQNIKHAGGPHWYLKHKETGEILDPTASQFSDTVPYSQGVGKGFLTKQPSKRAQIVIDAVRTRRLKKADLEKVSLTPESTANRMSPHQVHGTGLTETEQHDPLIDPSPDNLQRAKQFLARKWAERAVEWDRPVPKDLSGACKFASSFASKVFGGNLAGNVHHQWVEHPTAGRIDLTDAAGVPEHAKRLGHDRKFWMNREHRTSMASVEPRVQAWVSEFLGAPMKKSEHDPLDAMLAHDDPRERIMALRSRHVTPYHLRRALHDEDPDVRAAAAKHPMMTSSLIEETLRDGDLHTKQAALSRPDLQEHHLEIAIWDPDLQTQAALHPALTAEQKQKLINASDTPEGLRTELLAKSIGYLLYPHLEQARPPTEPMQRTHAQHLRFKQAFGVKVGEGGFTQFNRRRQEPMPPERRFMRASVSTDPKVPKGTVGHETQHAVFAALKQRYGYEAGTRIIATTLTALDRDDHQHLRNITDWAIKNKYDPIKEPEERIAHLHNYLQDGLWRKSAHKNMRIHMDRDAEKISHDWAKKIWQKLRNRAESLKPTDVGVVVRKDEEAITSWLSKQSDDVDYNVYEDMLGLTPKTDAYLEAAKFLAHTEPDPGAFRSALLNDAPLQDAALISVGLPVNDENRRALAAVLKLHADPSGLVKAEVAHEVIALMPDGVEVAEGVRRGFGASTEQQLHLGGKHSAGTLLVKDPETGQMYLLKPGSGKQSPARGARQDPTNQSRRETAFWHVAESWGLNQRLPRADLLLIDGQEVAAMHMLPFNWRNLEKLKLKDPGLPQKALEKYRQNGELHKWAVLDYVLGNPDRHGQNLMVGTREEGYPIALIDHGSAFAGSAFDPANDKNSFIPYYLRVWRAESWPHLKPEERLRAMPTVSGDTEHQLRDWFHGLHAQDLEAILQRYGIDPAPEIQRFARVKALLAEDNFSEAINRLWLAT